MSVISSKGLSEKINWSQMTDNRKFQITVFCFLLIILLSGRVYSRNKKKKKNSHIYLHLGRMVVDSNLLEEKYLKMSTKSSCSPGPRQSALPQSPSWFLEVSPSSGSPSPCPAVSKGGRSSRKGARSRSP